VNITLAEAATARRAGVRAPADRPSQRRSADAIPGTAWVRATVTGLRLIRAADGEDSNLLTFDGYASVTETPYTMYDFFGPYTEVVSAGAFDDTLNRADLDVPLVIAHDQTRRIARTTNGTLTLGVDDTGLRVQATLDARDHDVAYIAPKLEAELIDEMSFAFRIDAGHWSPDYEEYRIDKVDLHRGDVAIVGWGANPHTSGGLRAATRTGSEIVTEADLGGYRSLLA
jgi:hypothetical protein